jgi:hypothetical protein
MRKFGTGDLRLSRLARAKKIDLRITAIGLAVVLCLGAQAQEQAPALTAQDIQAASWGLQNYLDPELDMRKITMRDMTRILPDGSRGYVYMPDYEVGTTPYTGDPHKDSIIRLHEDVCAAASIVIAEAGSASSYLIHEDQGIVTARGFRIGKVISGDLNPGASITVVEFGGIVRDGSETLEVAIAGMKPFHDGDDYLLFLEKISNHPSSAYFDFNFSHPQVIHERIYAQRRAGDDIIDPAYGIGESVEEFQSNIERATSLGSCH